MTTVPGSGHRDINSSLVLDKAGSALPSAYHDQVDDHAILLCALEAVDCPCRESFKVGIVQLVDCSGIRPTLAIVRRQYGDVLCSANSGCDKGFDGARSSDDIVEVLPTLQACRRRRRRCTVTSIEEDRWNHECLLHFVGEMSHSISGESSIGKRCLETIL